MPEAGPSIAEISPPTPKPEVKAPETTPKAEAPASESAKDLLTGIESFTTAKGSVYSYDSEGRTTRFKTATGEQHERQDITVFSDLSEEENQQILHAIHKPRESDANKKVYVVELDEDKVPKYIEEIDEVSRPDDLYLCIVEDGKPLLVKKASLEPQVGMTTYDTRLYEGDDGQTYRERHLGNKVTEIKRRNDVPKAEDETPDAEAATGPEESTPRDADDKELPESEESSDLEEDTDGTEDSTDKKRRIQALVKRVEKFQDKHPRLGLREIARVETEENRETRIRKTISGLTNKESYDELLAELKTTHPEQSLETLDKLLKKNLTSSVLKKSSRKDLRIIEGMLKDPDSYPEIKKIQGNLESMLPEEMKSRNTKKVKKAIGVLIFGLLAELVGQTTKETA